MTTVINTQRVGGRAFVALATVSVLAAYALASWLDGDAPLPEEQLTEAQFADLATFEHEREHERERRAAQDRLVQVASAAYQQGLQEGARGAIAASHGQADLQVAQACLALQRGIAVGGRP